MEGLAWCKLLLHTADIDPSRPNGAREVLMYKSEFTCIDKRFISKTESAIWIERSSVLMVFDHSMFYSKIKAQHLFVFLVSLVCYFLCVSCCVVCL